LFVDCFSSPDIVHSRLVELLMVVGDMQDGRRVLNGLALLFKQVNAIDPADSPGT
jgi:hypothetical protein